MDEPITPTTCDHCGKLFNTSAVHPRRYCSIACEEGRGMLAQDNPAAPDYHLHLQGNPSALVGKWLVACGLKRVDYSPEWARDPEQVNTRNLVEVNESEKVYIRYDDVVVGKVWGYDRGVYDVEYEDMETNELINRKIDASLVVSQLRQDNWWVDG